jgi:hypothetical protein
MANDLIKIINAETGEEIEREMTDEEQASRDLQVQTYSTEKAEKETEAAAIQVLKEAAEAKLAVLGLTTEDLRALGL